MYTLRKLFQQTLVRFKRIQCLCTALIFAQVFALSPAPASADNKTAPLIPADQLEQQISARLMKVQEFEFIRAEAKKLGVRAWLFGGTASAYSHYVNWDLKREAGDHRFQPARFDYDYTNIYRSTQDLDIVIDGSAEQAGKLQQALQQKYPHLQGSKTAWEVRLLRSPMGEKEALLDNADFLNQHTDSNSTGMVEITQPPKGEAVVRDLRDWNAHQQGRRPIFFEDIRRGTLHYYFSKNHTSTKRYKEGLNPPIVSVIRYLTKAFQYELQIIPEELKTIKETIDAFDPKAVGPESYVGRWIEKNGKKLLQNAVNIEYAVTTLDQLGLRKKLYDIRRNPNETGTDPSLSWWMQKEPLRTHPVGKGQGKTAKELGIDIIAHETNSFLAYESITRAHTGQANVLISRKDAPGEAAANGDGFYVLKGKQGAVGSGLTIRFKVRPDAREESDFLYDRGSHEVVIRNKAILEVIPESLNIGPVRYFEMFAAGQALSSDDRGILEKLKRRLNRDYKFLSKEDFHKIFSLAEAGIAQGVFDWLGELATITEMQMRPEFESLLEKLVEKKPGRDIDAELVTSFFSKQGSSRNPKALKWLETLIDRGNVDGKIAEEVFKNEEWSKYPEAADLIQKLMKKGYGWVIALSILKHEGWAKNPRGVSLLRALMADGIADREILISAFEHEAWLKEPEVFNWLLKMVGGRFNEELARNVLSHDYWTRRPEGELLLEKLLYRGNAAYALAEWVLPNEKWAEHPRAVQWLEKIIEDGYGGFLAKYVFPKEAWSKLPQAEQIIRKLIARDDGLANKIAEHVLSRECWARHPKGIKLLEVLLNGTVRSHVVDENIFTKDYWIQNENVIERLIKKEKWQHLIATKVLTSDYWATHPRGPEFAQWYISNGLDFAASKILETKHFRKNPKATKLMDQWVASGKGDYFIVKVLTNENWFDHPKIGEWLNTIIERKTESLNLFDSILKQEHWTRHPLTETLIEKLLNASQPMPSEFGKQIWARHPKGASLFIKWVMTGQEDWATIDQILRNNEHWREHPELMALCKGKPVTKENIINALKGRNGKCLEIGLRKLVTE